MLVRLYVERHKVNLIILLNNTINLLWTWAFLAIHRWIEKVYSVISTHKAKYSIICDYRKMVWTKHMRICNSIGSKIANRVNK